MTNAERILAMRECLAAALHPVDLAIADESHKHAGHAGARDGRGHFQVRIVSDEFHGRGRLARHRLVYAALGGLMQSDIHALAIEALTAEEAATTATGRSR
jgi:BolA family transcriptional regulator, general stress-responsive regulator